MNMHVRVVLSVFLKIQKIYILPPNIKKATYMNQSQQNKNEEEKEGTQQQHIRKHLLYRHHLFY